MAERRRFARATVGEPPRAVRPIMVGVLVAMVLADLALGRLPLWVAALYPAMGVVSFYLYGVDKRRAEQGRFRVAESLLQGIDALCGIGGGLLGQQFFHHKTAKPTFIGVSYTIYAIHLMVLGGLLFGVWTLADLAAGGGP